MTVLFQVHTRKVELLVGLDLLGQQGCLGTVGDRTDVVSLGMPLEHGPRAIDEVLLYLEGQFVELSAFDIDNLRQHLFGTDGRFLLIIHLTVVISKNNADILLRSSEES